MAISFEIDVARGLVITEVSGDVTPKDMAAYQDALFAHADFSPHHATLMDFSDAQPFRGSSEEIQRLVSRLRVAPGTRRAYVAPLTLHFGLSRMAQVYVEDKGVEAQVFRDRPAALRWLAGE